MNNHEATKKALAENKCKESNEQISTGNELPTKKLKCWTCNALIDKNHNYCWNCGSKN